MKKLLLAFAFAGAILFTAQNAMAQCCAGFDVDGDPNTPDVACGQPAAPDPNSPPSSACGCVDLSPVLCIGGFAGPEAQGGCIGVLGTIYIVDSSGTPGDAAGCTEAAATNCAANGCAS
jgi:hypothetical protein